MVLLLLRVAGVGGLRLSVRVSVFGVCGPCSVCGFYAFVSVVFCYFVVFLVCLCCALFAFSSIRVLSGKAALKERYITR